MVSSISNSSVEKNQSKSSNISMESIPESDQPSMEVDYNVSKRDYNTSARTLRESVAEDIITTVTRKISQKRVRRLSENGRQEMFDSIWTGDMNGIWTFEGFQPIRDVPHGAGLINVKNSCFINSVLQSLVHIPPFTRYVLEKHNHSNVICVTCGDKTVRYQTFLDLNLALPQNWRRETPPTTTDLLMLHMKDEKIELTCSKCGCNWKTMSSSILRCPSVLLLHILRFSGYTAKSDMKVNIERNISLKRFTYLQDGDERYELSSAIFHNGPSADHGHYTAMTKGFDDKYYYFDDEHVKLVRELNGFSTRSTYMLFYSHMKPQERMSIENDALIVNPATSVPITRISMRTNYNTFIPKQIMPKRPKFDKLWSFSPVDVSESFNSQFHRNEQISVSSLPSSFAKREDSSINSSFDRNIERSGITSIIPRNVCMTASRVKFCSTSLDQSLSNSRENGKNDNFICVDDKDNPFLDYTAKPAFSSNTQGIYTDLAAYDGKHHNAQIKLDFGNDENVLCGDILRSTTWTTIPN
ncbi:ubiquitinyl hydrolase 1 [Dictyocaulus viviparus]|uniref:Ubiquitinyl hydrolase 1 n=1 Tax=Dictyocaulus viviparus TaxID=29172 RepID=A0A0D8XGL2_DICVI|nr:ubiquitinyl hydrolase 1 [Dictyocaulus viviparus]